MYRANSPEPAEVYIKPCPCCGSEASAATGRATVYIQCNNSNCQLATKGWSNRDKAVRAWNMRVWEVEAIK